MKIQWVDSKRQPKCSPDPRYPLGIDIDASGGAQKTCTAQLPYPADRCGFYTVECEVCGLHVAATTAGRPDDPRSIKMACKRTNSIKNKTATT